MEGKIRILYQTAVKYQTKAKQATKKKGEECAVYITTVKTFPKGEKVV